MTFPTLADKLTVASGLSVPQAVARALAHFGCGDDGEDRVPGPYEGLVVPSFTLVFRGANIPVSLEDTPHSLTRRIHLYLDDADPAEAAA